MRARIVAAALAAAAIAGATGAAAQQLHNRAGRTIMVYVYDTRDLILAIACDSWQLNDNANEVLSGNSKCPFSGFALKIHRPELDLPAPPDCLVRDVGTGKTVMVEFNESKGLLNCTRY